MAFIYQNPQINGNYYFINPEQAINTPPSFIGGQVGTLLLSDQSGLLGIYSVTVN